VLNEQEVVVVGRLAEICVKEKNEPHTVDLKDLMLVTYP
jgi:hypothetical protein